MMVSKNNKYQKELLNSQRVPHFGLRKLGIGVASVLLGTTFYFGGNMANVHADATPAATNNNGNATQTTNVNSAETNQAVALKTGTQTSTAGNSSAPVSQSATAQQATNEASSVNNINTTNVASASASTASNATSTLQINPQQVGKNDAGSLAQSAVQDNTSQGVMPASTNDQSTPTTSNEYQKLQKLSIQQEPDANVSATLDGTAVNVTPATGDNPNVYGNPYKSTVRIPINQDSDVVKITYSGLRNSNFNGKAIKSIVVTFNNFKIDTRNGNTTGSLSLYNNFYAGFWYSGIDNVTATVQLFYDNDQKDQVVFDNSDNGSAAYFVLGSLNNYSSYHHIEKVRVVNGEALPLPGSTISVHSNGWLYADEPNESTAWVNPQTGKTETSFWDTYGPDGTYVGAGIDKLSGNTAVVEFSVDATPQETYAWATLHTQIPTSVITDKDTSKTVTETIHYKYSDGTKAKDDKVQSQTVYKTGYFDSTKEGQVNWLDWSTVPVNFPQVDSPQIAGYTADKPIIGSQSTTADKNIEFTVIYSQTQQAQVLYRDLDSKDNSGNPVVLDQDNNLTGVAGQTITDPNVDNKIKNLESKGYVLKNNGFPADAAFDNDGSKIQTFYIDFVHGTTDNIIKQTGTQTIHYVGAGDKTPADNKQSFDFTKTITHDNVTGKDIKDTGWNVTSHTFGNVNTPFIQGYHADKTSAGKTTVTPTDLTKEVTVTYAPNGKIIPVDPNGKPIPNAPTPQYPTDPTDVTKVTPDEPVPTIPGWTPDQPTVTPSDPGTDTDVVYRVPAKDEGVVNVIVKDETTGQTLSDYGWTSHTKEVGTKVDFDKPGTITNLENAGYKVINPDVTIPSEIAKGTYTATIYVEHQTVPVTPDTPGTPGQPINPKNPNSPKYPSGTDKDSLTKTITRTIHYVGAGDKTPKDVQQPVTFTQKGILDKVTGEWITPLTWSSDTQMVTGEKTPVVDGYHVTNVDRDSQDKINVDNAIIHNTDADYTVTVTYAPNGKIIPVDPNGKPIPNVPTPQYPTDPTDPSRVTPDEPVPNVPGMTPETPTVTPKNPGKDTEVVYHEPTQDEGVVNVFVHDTTTGQNLPEYNWTSNTNKVGTKVDYDKANTITKLTNAGYKILNPDVTIPGEITKGTTNITIYVEHKTTTVTPKTPGKPGEPVDPNNPNGPKYPSGTDLNNLKKTGTQTIHYVGAGDKTPADNKQSFDFTKTITFDNVTGKIINDSGWNVSSHTFGRVDTPVVQGYHADKASAGETTITPTDLTKEVTVTYAPNGKIVPVDPNGKPIPNVPTPQYPTDPTDPSKVTPDEPVPNVPGMTPETPTVTPKDPGKDTEVVYHEPTQDEGIVNVIVHDTTTGQNLPKYGWTSGTQKTGTKVDFDKPTTIKDLENAGYKVLNPDVTVPSEITKGETNVVINVEHGTTTVTPGQPGTPGQPVDPNNPNGPKYPDGTDLNNLKKTGTQTIHYVGAGDKTPADNTQSFDFTKTITFDNVTGKIIKDSGWSVASHTFGNVATPVVPGYHADKASAGGTTITPDDLTKEVTVTYAPNGKIVPVDPNGNPIPNVPTPQYPTDPNDPTKVTPDEPVPTVPGYTPETPTVTPKDPGKDTNVIYNVPTKDEGVVNVIVTDTTTGQNLPDYGWTSGTQKTGTKVDFDKPGTIKKLEDAGYKVTNPDVTVPGEITKGTTNVVIKVEHQIVPVTPDKPGNGLKDTDLTKTVTETVHYVGADDLTPADKTTQLHFTGTAYYDAVTKKWTDANGHELKDQTKNITWTAKDGNSFAAVETPAIDGYTVKVQDGYDDGNGNVKEIDNIDQTSGDIAVTVTYSKTGQPTTPTNPTNPETPTNPENPNTPTNPENPTTPVTPENPNNNSETPVNPGTPTNSNTPNGSTNSVYPGAPTSSNTNTPMNLANTGANTYMGSTVQPVVSHTSYGISKSTKKHSTLPQTGNNDAVSAAALGLMGLAVTASLGLGATKKRHE